MKPWKKKCLTLAVVCSLAGASHAYAAEKSDAADAAIAATADTNESLSSGGGHDLGETTVTATRIAEPVNKVPANVTVITAKELEKRHVFSLREALEREAGIYVSPTADVKDGLSLRGFGSTNILVMYNGQQLNNSFDGGVNWDSIPLDNIDRVEIVRGAGSSLYGGHAVAGVINIISKDKEHAGIHGQANVSYGSNNTWKRGAQVSGREGSLSFRLGYEKRTSDGWAGYYVTPRISSGNKAGTVTGNLPQAANGRYIVGSRGAKDKKSENTFLDLNYAFDKDRSLDYTYMHNSYRYSYHDPFTYLKNADGTPAFEGIVHLSNRRYINVTPADYLGYNGEREQDIHKLRYEDTKNSFKAGIGYSDTYRDGYSSTGSATSIDWTGAGGRTEYPNKNYNVDVQKKWQIKNNTLLAGAAWMKDKMRYRSYNLANWTDWSSVVGDPTMQSGGAIISTAFFVQDEITLDPRWRLQLGLRYDNFSKEDGYSYVGSVRKSYDEKRFSAWSPKVAVSYEPKKDILVFASFGKSFNPPSIYKLYRRAGDKMSSVQANPLLTPETSTTYEVGIKQKIDKNTSYGLTLFRVATDDKISLATLGGVRAYYNMDSSRTKGVEFEIKHRLNRDWRTYLNYTFESGEITSAGVTEHDWDIPKHMLSFGIDYTKGNFNGVLDAQYVGARQSVDSVTGEYGSEDSFFLTNLYFNYNVNENLKLQLAVRNLFDRHFYAYEAANERTYTLGASYSF